MQDGELSPAQKRARFGGAVAQARALRPQVQRKANEIRVRGSRI